MTSIKKLDIIANKPVRLIIGLMSGTSLDGLDIAFCRFKGKGPETEVEVLNFKTQSYSTEFQEAIRKVFAQRKIDLQELCLLNAFIARKHAAYINNALADWNVESNDVDLIASHGQTIYHAPARQHRIEGMPDATLQIGDGDHIARLTGIITVSDFRQKHVAAGGEGAPLAVYGDYLIFSSKEENRVMLNIGGIANFTYLPKSLNPVEVMCTDVGPGNTLSDAFVRANFPGKRYDEGGEIASKGKANNNLLEALLEDSFFNQTFPKTTGPEVFNLEFLKNALTKSGTGNLASGDILATLNSFTARAIALALKSLKVKDYVIYASGGGIHNKTLLSKLQDALQGITIKTTQSLGINPDAKEAVLFASLANECVSGVPLQIGGVPAVRLGKISLPD